MLHDDPQTRRDFLEHAVAAALAGRSGILKPFFAPPTHGSELDSLTRATGWLNTVPLTAAELRGKVVLVQFWTFTCINWLRTLPYVRAWADKYREAGLIVIGAHTPEFPFERNADNLRRLARDLNVTYPIAIDNDHSIWNGFRNQYWPALYLVDGKGQMRYQHFGEGAYSEIERAIQQLLEEAGARQFDHQLTSPEGRGLEAPADSKNLRTPETYAGYARAENFASPGGAAVEREKLYTIPRELRVNEWAIAGGWTVERGAIALNEAGGRIAFKFHARDLQLVMGPPPAEPPTRFRVSLDGIPPAAAHGADVDEQGNGIAKDQRLYQLIRQPLPIVDRVFQIEFLDRGVEAFSFTFG